MVNIDNRSELMFESLAVTFQGGVVSSLNLDPREPSWLG